MTSEDEHRKRALRARRDLEAAIYGLATHPDMLDRNRIWRLAEKALEEAENSGYLAGRHDARQRMDA